MRGARVPTVRAHQLVVHLHQLAHQLRRVRGCAVQQAGAQLGVQLGVQPGVQPGVQTGQRLRIFGRPCAAAVDEDQTPFAFAPLRPRGRFSRPVSRRSSRSGLRALAAAARLSLGGGLRGGRRAGVWTVMQSLVAVHRR